MPSAKIQLANGTIVSVEGTVEEVAQISALLTGRQERGETADSRRNRRPKQTATSAPEQYVDIAKLVALIRDCDEAQAIEEKILDQRDNLHRVLLPIFILNWHLDENAGLTSGEISKVTDQLGVKIHTSNASGILSGRAKSFVAGDSVRKKGSAVRYKLTRRGMQHMRDVIGIG